MSAPTIKANAAIFLKIILMIGTFSLAHSSSVKPKQSPTFYLLKQLNNSCSQIDNFGPISPAWYCVTPARQAVKRAVVPDGSPLLFTYMLSM
jgi:hypothetical protein